MAEFSIDIHEEDGARIVAIAGPVDGITIEQFKTTLHPFSRESHAKLIFDFKELTYLNSSAFGVLSALHKSVLKNMGKLVICNQNKRIEKGMSLLGLSHKIKIFASREEAKEYLQS